MKPTVYLVCGVSGSGKSWVCEQLCRQAKYISFDKTSKEEALAKMLKATIPVLYDPPIQISTFIKRHSDKLDIIPLFIIGDFLKVKEQLKSRGGKITKGLYKRWARMRYLSQKMRAYHGTSAEVLKFLQKALAGKIAYTIYKATSPSGKVYIGKTNSLQDRMIGHKHDALVANKPWLFSKAIRKYGFENINFEVIQDNIFSFNEASFLEGKYIKEFRSKDPAYGYNLTEGGEGCQLTSFALGTKRAALKTFYSSEVGSSLKEQLSIKAKTWHKTEDGANAVQKSKLKRSSKESRQLTSILNKERYKSKEARKRLSKAVKRAYADPDIKKKISEIGKAKRAKSFSALDEDGILVGTWVNQVQCAKDLGIKACGISKALNGNISTYKGLRFTYN